MLHNSTSGHHLQKVHNTGKKIFTQCVEEFKFCPHFSSLGLPYLCKESLSDTWCMAELSLEGRLPGSLQTSDFFALRIEGR